MEAGISDRVTKAKVQQVLRAMIRTGHVEYVPIYPVYLQLSPRPPRLFPLRAGGARQREYRAEVGAIDIEQ